MIAPATENLLEVNGVDIAYGPVKVVRGLTMHVGTGEVVALLGANGAGKTTTLRGISGVVRPHTGRVRFAGRRIDGADPTRIVATGLAHVPEGRRVFASLSVENNLRLGGWRTRHQRARERENTERVFELFPRLSERRRQDAGSLSGGEQQMLAIGRALMAEPKLLAIDELSLGLAPKFVDELMTGLVALNRAGLALLVVEQFVDRALAVADRLYILDRGSVAFAGTPAEASSFGAIENVYLAGEMRR